MKYPADIPRDDYDAFAEAADTHVMWSYDGDERDAISQMSSALTANLEDLDIKVDGGQKNAIIQIELPAPIGYIPIDPDDQKRLYAVQQALVNGAQVSIDGQDVDDYLGLER